MLSNHFLGEMTFDEIMAWDPMKILATGKRINGRYIKRADVEIHKITVANRAKYSQNALGQL